MYAVEITTEKGRHVGRVLAGQLSEEALADKSTRVTIPGALMEVIDPSKHILVCDSLDWSTGRKSWYMTKPKLVEFPIVDSSPILQEIKFTKEDEERFVEKSLLSEVTEMSGSISVEKDGYYVSDSVFKFLLRNFKRRGQRYMNTLLVGPSGCGKTSLVKVICDKFGIPFSKFDMGACTGDANSVLLGIHRIKDGKSIFDYADFVYKIQQPGVILLDEINRADQTAMNILLPVLDDTRVLRLDIGDAEERREIPVHPDCIFVATANIGSEYAGTNEMDAALKNRFLVVEIDDMPANEEAKVLSKKCEIAKTEADIIVKVANSVRDIYTKGQVSYKISTRETQAVGDLVHDGLTISESLKWVFCPKFTGTLKSGEKNLVNQTIDTFFSGKK